MTAPERLAADLAHIGLEQAEAAGRGDWDAVRRYDQVRRTLLAALGAEAPVDSEDVRTSLRTVSLAAARVEQALRIAGQLMTAELRKARLGGRAGQAYGAFSGE